MNNSNHAQNIPDPFEKVITFGELKKLLPSTGARHVPGIRQLKAMATVVLQAKTSSGVIKVYDNGFFTYTENGRSTVYGVDSCSVLEWDYCNDERATSAGINLNNLPWELPLELAGTNRLTHNSNSKEEEKVELSLDVPAAVNNIIFSVRPHHETEEAAEEENKNRLDRIHRVRSVLMGEKPRNRRIIMLYYCEKRSQTEIGKMLGVSQQYVQKITSSFSEKMQKAFRL